jgi:RHS repeat-associated protein
MLARTPFFRVVAQLLVFTLFFGLIPAPPAEASISAAERRLSLPALPSLAESVQPTLLAVVVAIADDDEAVPCAVVFAVMDPHLSSKYHRARWMDPSTGRFIGMDPFEGLEFEPPTLHKYLYGAADPVNRIDPSGEFTTVQVAVTVGALFATVSLISSLQQGAGPTETFVNAGLSFASGFLLVYAATYGVSVAAARSVLVAALRAFPFLFVALVRGTLSPASLRTVEGVRAVSPKDASIIARAMEAFRGGGFPERLTAVLEALRRVVPDGQLYPIGTWQGAQVFGSVRTGIGLVEVGGTTFVVQMRGGQLVQNFGPF